MSGVALVRRWAPGRPLLSLCLLLPLSFLSGCAFGPSGLYDWGQYEDSTYARLVEQDDGRAWSEIESTVVELQGRAGARIPPGLFADYGYALFKRGQHQRAIECFEREMAMYPEATPLMKKLVEKVRQKQTEASASVQPSAAK